MEKQINWKIVAILVIVGFLLMVAYYEVYPKIADKHYLRGYNDCQNIILQDICKGAFNLYINNTIIEVPMQEICGSGRPL